MSTASDVPEYLQHAFDWLRKVLPDGIPISLYREVLFVLYNEFSDRNLATLIANFTEKDYAFVYNDILGLFSNPPAEQDITQVRQLFFENGFPEALELPDSPLK